MTFEFRDSFPDDLNLSPLLISRDVSRDLNGRQFLIVIENDLSKSLYEIRYEYHCSPFKEALIVDNVLAVGFEEHFYLFDLGRKANMLAIKMEGYFGHLYADGNNFYVADAFGLYCIDKNASVKWHNASLAIDGVIVSEFFENTISGSGEWDPPGGWRDFVLNKQTGIVIK